MPTSSRTRTCRILAVAIGVAVSTVVLAPQAQAQRGLGASASVALSVTVPAALSVVGVAPVRVDTVGDAVVITERVSVRSNVSHLLVARSAHDAATEVRVRRGEWAAVTATGTGVANTDRTGETTHLVQCRRPVSSVAPIAGCGLAFELVSTDPAWPASSRLSMGAR